MNSSHITPETRENKTKNKRPKKKRTKHEVTNTDAASAQSKRAFSCKILKTRLGILGKRRGEKTIFMRIMLIVATGNF